MGRFERSDCGCLFIIPRKRNCLVSGPNLAVRGHFVSIISTNPVVLNGVYVNEASSAKSRFKSSQYFKLVKSFSNGQL